MHCATLVVCNSRDEEIKAVSGKRKQCHGTIWVYHPRPTIQIKLTSQFHRQGSTGTNARGRPPRGATAVASADNYLEVITSGINISSQLQRGTGALWSPTKTLQKWKARTSQKDAGLRKHSNVRDTGLEEIISRESGLIWVLSHSQLP